MPGLTSIFLPEKPRHLFLSRSEQQQLEATDLLQIDLLDSTAVLCCFFCLSPHPPLSLADSLPLMVATVYQSGSATVANLNPILRTHFLCAGCRNRGTETRCPSLNLVDPAPKLKAQQAQSVCLTCKGEREHCSPEAASGRGGVESATMSPGSFRHGRMNAEITTGSRAVSIKKTSVAGLGSANKLHLMCAVTTSLQNLI